MKLPASVVALLLCLCPVSQSLDLCVVPDTGDCEDCPLLVNNTPCNTLQYYANNSNFTSNSIFHFLEGEHTLNTVVEVTNVANLTLVGVGPHQNLNKVQGSGFKVTNFDNFRVENIKFSDGTFFLTNGSGLSIDHVTFFSITATNLRNHSSISNSRFLDSKTTCFIKINYTPFGRHCPGPSHISINNCEILSTQSAGWGIYLFMGCPNVHVVIANLAITNSRGGGKSYYNLVIFFNVFTGNFIELRNITISNGTHVDTAALRIGLLDSLRYTDPLSCGPNATRQPHHLMEISNMTITKNSAGAGLSIRDYSPPETECNVQYILIRDSAFTENVAHGVASVFFSSNTSSPFKTIQVTFKNVSISSSITFHPDASNSQVSVYFSRVVNVTFIDCTFENNKVTAIMAVGSNLRFQGNNTFRNNSAVNGAGIMLLQNSYLYLHSNTSITFADNHASENGGAMYIDGDRELPIPKEQQGLECSIQYVARYSICTLYFINNTAGTAGSSLYWMTRTKCRCSQLRVVQDHLQAISNLQNTESDPSAISSDPIRICQCLARHHMPNCSSAFPTIRAYPGEDFTLRLAVVGTMNGTVPGTIYATFPQTSPQARLGDLQDTQETNDVNCEDITYTVYSSHRLINFHLTAAEYSLILNISVDLKPCPTGFVLDNDTCKCDHVISRENIHCFINNQSILRPANTWMGFLDISNKTGVVFSEHCPHGYCLPHDVYLSGDDPANTLGFLDISKKTGVVFSKYCPHGYCLPRDVYLSADDPDIQCADNRTGVLCGQCVKNYSLTLGSQKCSECSNLYLLLLFPLAASGLVLVAVLFVLNLTVTEGSINGLIFYANVISMSQYSGTSSQLYTFIAWLNLDLGIDTCFYDGMDAYTETWLQFAFPLYLWLIIAAIIVVCNIFPKLTERGTQNAVKVLATLFLLSYTKLQRMLVTIFSFTTLRYPSGEVHYVWLYDANVHFLKGKHIYLFLAGVLVLCLLVLPYTFGLALFQYLQACSGRRVCRWVNKLKPVFDAYAGPYKDRYRMWTGLLLVTRTFLIILFSLNEIITASPDFNHFVTLITSLALLCFSTRGIYRKWPCDFLEAFFYAQFGFFSGGALYASLSNGSASAVADFSFATTLLVFLVIVGYHAFSSFRNVACCCKGEEALDREEEEQLLFRERERLDSSLVSHPCYMAIKQE